VGNLRGFWQIWGVVGVQEIFLPPVAVVGDRILAGPGIFVRGFWRGEFGEAILRGFWQICGGWGWGWGVQWPGGSGNISAPLSEIGYWHLDWQGRGFWRGDFSEEILARGFWRGDFGN
jgi:hypothetical protein